MEIIFCLNNTLFPDLIQWCPNFVKPLRKATNHSVQWKFIKKLHEWEVFYRHSKQSGINKWAPSISYTKYIS